MALVHADNFSIYGTTVSLLTNGIYAEVSSDDVTLVNDPDGISSGKVIHIDGGYGGGGAYALVRYVLPTIQATVGIGLRIWMDSLPPDTTRKLCFMQWRDVSNVPRFSVTTDTTGRLQLRSGNFDGTVLVTTTNPVISANGWYHLEGAAYINASGTIEVRVEGIPVIEYTGDTSGNNIAQIAICNDPTSSSVSTPFYFKDLVVWDGSGTENNDFLGSVLVVTLLPVSDVSLNWTPSTGSTGYEILDNIPPNDGVYLTAPNPAPAAYVCDLSDLPEDVTSVKAVMTIVRAAKTDGGDASLQNSVISGITDGAGLDRPITIAQTYWRDIFETDPSTLAPWTPSAVNDMQMKMNRTS